MIAFVGFEEEPFSQILWEKDGNFQSRTVCYSEADEERALDRFQDPNDFYHKNYDKAVVVRGIDNRFVVTKVA